MRWNLSDECDAKCFRALTLFRLRGSGLNLFLGTTNGVGKAASQLEVKHKVKFISIVVTQTCSGSLGTIDRRQTKWGP